MATIIKLTKVKRDEAVRVNFDTAAYYRRKGKGTEIVFMSPNYYEQKVHVKETLEEVDRLLGI